MQVSNNEILLFLDFRKQLVRNYLMKHIGLIKTLKYLNCSQDDRIIRDTYLNYKVIRDTRILRIGMFQESLKMRKEGPNAHINKKKSKGQNI